jgi:hypothetical protein
MDSPHVTDKNNWSCDFYVRSVRIVSLSKHRVFWRVALKSFHAIDGIVTANKSWQFPSYSPFIGFNSSLSLYSSSCSFYGLDPMACSHSDFVCNYISYRQFVGVLGRGISQSRGHYLHRATQTQRKRIHPCLEWDSNPSSQWSSRRRHFMP